jgi:hypothetical protein
MTCPSVTTTEQEEETMYDAIISIANKRPVKGADFTRFVGESEWISLDDPDCVTMFKVRRILSGNTVEILAKIDELVPDGTLMHFDADELAIRMEDA